MKIKVQANRLDAYDLLHRSVLTFADLEENGICIDVPYYERQRDILQDQIDDILDDLQGDDLIKTWRKVFGSKFNIDSNPQLATVLFDEMGHEPIKFTKKGDDGKAAVDEEALDGLGIPAVSRLIESRRLKKAKNTYIAGILREEVDGLIHPSFTMAVARSIRSSCFDPNFQNIPVRNEVIAKIIRSGIVPRGKNRVIGELDCVGNEVRAAVCYHKDPTMIQYIEDPTKDMHRDMAMEIYCLDLDQVNKMTRYCAKNRFVFPVFFGSYWETCADNLWKAIGSIDLTTANGTPLKKHLAGKMVTGSVGDWEGRKRVFRSEKVRLNGPDNFKWHLKAVEDRFWNDRFSQYTRWKENHWNEYQKTGYFDILTGFRYSGYMSKNQAINYPIQGTAFHWLLWMLNELNDWMDEQECRSLIIGQIHDSIIFDFVPEEIDDILGKAYEIMTQDIREYWDWIIVPLDVEAELSPPGASWFEKKEVSLGT